MISWCSHTLQEVSVYGSQYRLHSTAQLVRQRVGPTYMQGAGGAHDHVVFAWGGRGGSRLYSLTVTDELNLRADHSSSIIPMAEGGTWVLWMSNARRGPADPGQIGDSDTF